MWNHASVKCKCLGYRRKTLLLLCFGPEFPELIEAGCAPSDMS